MHVNQRCRAAPVIIALALGCMAGGMARATSYFSAPGASAPPLGAVLMGYRAVASWSCEIGGSRLIGIEFTAPVTFSHIGFIVNTLDGTLTDYYDVGLYNAAGALQAHTGAINLTATGYTERAISGGGSVTIQPGKYYMAFGCGAAATAEIEGGGGALASYATNDGGGVTTGGALPGSMTPPADSWGETSYFLVLH